MSSRRPKHGPLSEFELIDRIAVIAERSFSKEKRGRIPLGIGDDAALVRPRAGWDLVAAVDAHVEGVHFRREWARPEEIGWKALAVNLSDLAAVGAGPLACLVSIAAPKDWSSKALLAVHRGVVACGRAYGCPLIGGNVSGSPKNADPLNLHVTVLGEIPRGKALLRAGARVGDAIWLSGRVGEAALGLRTFKARGARARSDRSVRRYLKPRPRLELGARLRAVRDVRGVIDVSDGFLADLGHVMEASGGLGALIELAAVPVAAKLIEAVRAGKTVALETALAGGEDYELVFCAPSGAASAVARAAAASRTIVHRVGVVTSGPGIRLRTSTGKQIHWRRPMGWQHC